MLSLRAAATLLQRAGDLDALHELLAAAGVATERLPLDDAARTILGLESWTSAELSAGRGDVRVLGVRVRADEFRDELQRIARRLHSRTPHVHWFVAAVDPRGDQAAIAAWSAGSSDLRISALVWQPHAVVASDAETLRSLAAVDDEDDTLYHRRCVEVLGRDALTGRFYRELERKVDELTRSLPRRIDRESAGTISLMCISRLLFLQFLEAKGWLDDDRAYLYNRFADCMRTGGGFHQRVLLPLFFGTLNTRRSARSARARELGGIPFLNGGLFERTRAERMLGRHRFDDETIGSLFSELFLRYRFVAREDSASWSEASVDPEMLGRAFESLMQRTERREGGAYYTPHVLVARVAEQALDARPSVPLSDITVLDPACGSGAFLVYMLERIAELRLMSGESGDLASMRREVLARSIFGVDRNPMAVWLCELRLWLSIVIEAPDGTQEPIAPLPNLDRNVRVGDALTGGDFAAMVATGSATASLRLRYMRSTGMRKAALARRIDLEERRRVISGIERDLEARTHARRELLCAARTRDLFGERTTSSRETRLALKALRQDVRTLRSELRRIEDRGALPFAFAAVFADIQRRGGFDLIVGNPPWVRLHRIPSALRTQFRRTFESYRAASWESGRELANAAKGFAGQVDLAALFVERSLGLVRNGGVASLLLPIKLWRSLAGGGVRGHLLERGRVERVEDLSATRKAFDAVTYPSLLVARAMEPGGQGGNCTRVAIHDRSAWREWAMPTSHLPFDDSRGAPWLLLTPESRAVFDLVRASGRALATTAFGAPRLGVKSGCNAAYVIDVRDSRGEVATIAGADGDGGCVERDLLRPVIRGDDVQHWTRTSASAWIIWTHGQDGAPLRVLPPHARKWLGRYYGALTQRADAARTRRWWSLFRTDAADHRRHRVVWADIGRRPTALVLPAGDTAVPLNSCYVLHCEDIVDARALATLLNSELAAAWLNALAEPARGGYHRYLGWTVGLLPVPHDWRRARSILDSVFDRRPDEVLRATLDAYGLSRDRCAPLLDWQL